MPNPNNGVEEVVGSIPSGSTIRPMTSSSSSPSSAKPAAKLTDFKALTFDCYGTLIDWELGMIEALKPLTSKASRALTRDEILEAHARHESSQQVQTPAKLYRDLACGRLSPPGRRMGRCGELDGLRRLWPVDPQLAGLR